MQSKIRSLLVVVFLVPGSAWAQLTDRTQAPNNANVGIAKSLQEETGAGRGNSMIPGSSIFIINRDPFRSVRRGRQLFQRKFTRLQGQGPNEGDGAGELNTNGAIGAGLSDSCALCHGRPRGSAGIGGNVATRPDSRDAPHLFGLGLREMLADEITTDLRNTRQQASAKAAQTGKVVTMKLVSKGIHYGSVTATPSGTVDYSKVQGVDPDLRVKPFLLRAAPFPSANLWWAPFTKRWASKSTTLICLPRARAKRSSRRPAWCWTGPRTRSVRLRHPTLRADSSKSIPPLWTTWSSIS